MRVRHADCHAFHHLRHLRDHLLQGRCEIFQNHDRFNAGILQLVFEFARRVERVDVDHRATGAQDAENRHRILQHVGVVTAARAPFCSPLLSSQAPNARDMPSVGAILVATS